MFRTQLARASRPLRTTAAPSLNRPFSVALLSRSEHHKPTASQEQVHADKHDHSPETLVKHTKTTTESSTTSESEVKVEPPQSSSSGGKVSPSSKTSKSQEDHEADPHHPGKSDIEHLENPSLSEEAVHADRLSPEEVPLKK